MVDNTPRFPESRTVGARAGEWTGEDVGPQLHKVNKF